MCISLYQFWPHTTNANIRNNFICNQNVRSGSNKVIHLIGSLLVSLQHCCRYIHVCDNNNVNRMSCNIVTTNIHMSSGSRKQSHYLYKYLLEIFEVSCISYTILGMLVLVACDCSVEFYQSVLQTKRRYFRCKNNRASRQ